MSHLDFLLLGSISAVEAGVTGRLGAGGGRAASLVLGGGGGGGGGERLVEEVEERVYPP